MEIEEGDVIQIIDSSHHWFPALLIVDEVKSWGCQAYMIHVTSNDPKEPNDTAYIRLQTDQFERIGEARMTLGKTLEEAAE